MAVFEVSTFAPSRTGLLPVRLVRTVPLLVLDDCEGIRGRGDCDDGTAIKEFGRGLGLDRGVLGLVP